VIGIIEDNMQTIAQLCTRFRVLRLELFGSGLTQDSLDPLRSDLDFLVEFLPLKQGEYADTYFGLLEAFEDLFHRHVDLVMTRAIRNPYFLESINRHRKVLYAA
jgi:predicted nucleotidyltransferase